ncbi:MAG: hypothetical protein KKH52_04505 [Nanoarchaeota archaeon]|nr:hypothetical protein [Nanoarchaeota archaeon]
MSNIKGMSKLWWILGTALIVVIFVILFGVFQSDSLGKIFGNIGDRLDDLGDCDRDGVANMFDKCPCLPVITSENSDLRGCPSDITTALDNEEDCTSEMCDEIESTSPDRTERSGVGTEGDLNIEGVTFDGNPPTETLPHYTVDLSGSDSYKLITIITTIKNIGVENIFLPFTVTYHICDNSGENCLQKDVYPTNSRTAPTESNEVTEQFDANGGEHSIPAYIVVGDAGDFCDGIGVRNCKLKIKVDADGALAEPEEDNNEEEFSIRLENQVAGSNDQLTEYASIELFANDDSDDGEPSTATIRQTCTGIVGRLSGCNSESDDCDDWFNSQSALGTNPSQGCWVLASEDDDGLVIAFNGNNDCAYAAAVEREIIDTTDPAGINTVSTPITDDEENGRNLFSWNWNNPGGSLLCAADHKWYECSSGNTGVINIGTDRFVCRNNHWRKNN